ncbi:MAG: polyprenyl synthetase family protein [bacterium]|nr:polyprenyl synthetase family protein [bacterium]
MTTLLKPSSTAQSGSLTRFQELVEPELLAWLDRKEKNYLVEASGVAELTSRLREFVARGGKRLRPALVFFAYEGCGGVDREVVLPLAMSTELLHTYLLIHDDIMDSADVRRGRPTAHILFEADHRGKRWVGDSQHHGESVAILLGDLAHSCAVELFLEAQAHVVRPELSACFTAMCQEVVLGQYLEMTAPYRESLSKEDLLKVLRLKSGRYSVERPIALGALAAGASGQTLEGLANYGKALGEAFQLKDDLLGVFGASDTVGKSVDSDIAEGKFTVLVQQALERSDDQGRDLLEAALGNRGVTEPQLTAAREVVEASGARAEIERMIESRLERAAVALKGVDLTAGAETFFAGLIAFLRDREH